MAEYIKVTFQGQQHLFSPPHDTTYDDEQWVSFWKFIGDFRYGGWTSWFARPQCNSASLHPEMFAKLMVELNAEWTMWRGLQPDPEDTDHTAWTLMADGDRQRVEGRVKATMAGIIAMGPDVFRAARNDGAKIFIMAQSEVGSSSDFRDRLVKVCKTD